MQIPKKHPMSEKQFDIVFLHNGQEVSFSSGVNPLTGSWMYWFSGSPAMYAGVKSDVNKIVKNIHKKSEGVLYSSFPLSKRMS
jgi:hypothetical protein